jgi:hypothetical protein
MNIVKEKPENSALIVLLLQQCRCKTGMIDTKLLAYQGILSEVMKQIHYYKIEYFAAAVSVQQFQTW